jgi:nucleotide-binding universal stress UspA family protein
MTGFRRILMATDFSPTSEAALEEAARLARESGAPLTILHVYESPAGATVPYLPAEGYLESLVAARTQAEARMQQLLTRASLRGLELRGVVARGLAGAQIRETAIREKADLIVMGTHGRRGAARLLLGSVAAHVIATAPCPVLTIRNQASAAATGAA